MRQFGYGQSLLGLGSVILIGVLGSHQAAAQANVSDEVKKSIAAAVQAAVADTIDKTVQTAVVQSAQGAAPAGMLTSTFWGRPQFSEFHSNFAPVAGQPTAPNPAHFGVELVPIGVILQATPDLFLGLSANYAHVEGFSANLYGGDGTATYVFYRQGDTNLRANLDFNIEQFSPDRLASSTSFGLTPSIDLERTIGAFVLTLSPGYAFGWSIPSGPSEPTQQFLTTAKITYIDGPWQPELSVEYRRTLHPSPASETVSFTPELNYVSGNFLVGLGYQYTTNTKQPNFYSHSVLANLRYRF